MTTVNSSVNYQPIQYSYPPNTKGAAKMTETIARENYNSQVYNIEHKPSYTLPIIGTIASAIAFIVVKCMK